MSIIEKRRVQRVQPDYAVIGQLPTGNVIIVDLSTFGARVDHQFPLAAGRRVRLEFACEGEKISISCDVTRCKLQRSGTTNGAIVYSSGLEFVDVDAETTKALRRVIGGFVTRHLAERKASRMRAATTEFSLAEQA